MPTALSYLSGLVCRSTLAAAMLTIGLSWAAQAQVIAPESEPAAANMTVDRMEAILTALDPYVERAGPAFRLTVGDVPLLVVTDVRADRMRAMVPIRSAEGLSGTDLMRMMQANFDSALDARYAIAEGRVWSVFIHPLSSLRRDQLISGLGQTVNLAVSYGSLFSSGAGQFGRGDSSGEQQKLLERLQRKDEDI
ncbi:MAG: hypothetical protein WBA02_07355 [Jannaschia helgolandensis]|uniref:hypothetical protein n=1 Tax=Jannaschia helgolandensis TaxID=188906 RepID=UPI003C7192E8